MNPTPPTPQQDVDHDRTPIRVADLSYEPSPPDSFRRMVRLILHFTILYAAASLLAHFVLMYPVINLDGFTFDPSSVNLGLLELIALTCYAIDLIALLALIVSPAMLLSGKGQGRFLIPLCWAHILCLAGVTLMPVAMNLGEFGDWFFYSLLSTVANLLLRLLFPLLFIGLFRGPRGVPLLQSAR